MSAASNQPVISIGLCRLFSRVAMFNIPMFSLAQRRADDRGLHAFYEPNSKAYTCIESALDIALKILEQGRSKEALADIALQFDDSTSNSARFGGDKTKARRWTGWFVDQLRLQTPRMILDETLGRQDVMAYHPREPWDGNLETFPFHQQSIYLNAQRAESMFAARTSISPEAGQQYRDHLFAFVTTIVHELGNILITWLGQGRIDTPGGRSLEMRLFGGVTEFWRDHNRGDDQVGEPYHIDENGWAWRISPNVIDEVYTYNFNFPFARTNETPVNPDGKQTMNSRAT
ncbi:hypothetical protein F5144DRAFT_578726 [Chaetomium tenue]|uniref:Uncharacterized protein n=1 Tax=Chaetomium tenue TaxID=1854479 RepID=A0ACB7P2R2_9PEZI|nr:hypothetical protein F5144DRAFT_578726 [Chaetomium globosum]